MTHWRDRNLWSKAVRYEPQLRVSDWWVFSLALTLAVAMAIIGWVTA